MKTIRKHSRFQWKTIGFTLILCGLVTLSCSNTEDSPKINRTGEDYEINGGIYTFYSNSEKYHDRDVQRGHSIFCEVETKISKVKREGNLLKIEILKPIDCQVKYEVIWDGVIRESHPMQSNLYIRALAEDCNPILFGTQTDNIILNLEETFRNIDKNVLTNTIFLIKDACSFTNVECYGNCEITVSN